MTYLTLTMNTNTAKWLKCLDLLSAELSERDMRTWIEPIEAEESSGKIKLVVPNKFIKEEVEKNYLELIRNALTRIDVSSKLEVGIKSSSPTKNRTEIITHAGFQTNLNTEMKFSSFVEGKSNQLARAAAMQVAEECHAEISLALDYPLTDKIQIIVYNKQNEWRGFRDWL